MDDWTYPYPDVEVPDTQPPLLFEDGRVMEARLARAQQAEAARVAELGAGLKLEKADAASIRTAVDAVLQTPSYRANAQNIRESFLRCGGAKAAVDRILSVADRR